MQVVQGKAVPVITAIKVRFELCQDLCFGIAVIAGGQRSGKEAGALLRFPYLSIVSAQPSHRPTVEGVRQRIRENASIANWPPCR